MDLVEFYIKQHKLGPFATKGERVQMAKAFIQSYKPDAEIHSKTRANNAPTSKVDYIAKRKRDSSQASNNSQNSQSTVGNKGGEPFKYTTPAQDLDHKGQNIRMRGGSISSTGYSNRSRVKLYNATPENPTYWQCLTWENLNPTHYHYCGECKNFKSTPRHTSTPGPKGPNRGGPRGRGYNKY